MIGWEGIIIKIDECKIGNCIYDRGDFGFRVWVLGGVEDSREKLFFIEVPDWKKETLTRVILQFVLPESIVDIDG